MSVMNLAIPSRLQLRLVVGTNEDGNEIFRLRTFGNVKPDTSDEDLMEVANGIGALQEYPVENVRRIDQSDLVDMG